MTKELIAFIRILMGNLDLMHARADAGGQHNVQRSKALAPLSNDLVHLARLFHSSLTISEISRGRFIAK